MLKARWPSPENVHGYCTTRFSFCEHENYHSGYDAFNLAKHVGDNISKVENNRKQLATAIGVSKEEFCWLEQVHSADCINSCDYDIQKNQTPKADAMYTDTPGKVCVVMTADCLPILLCNIEGTEIAAVHAGWRGLASGIIENTVAHFSRPQNLIAWLGPAISLQHFEVGSEVKHAFMQRGFNTEQSFVSSDTPGKWKANLYALARDRLLSLGVTSVHSDEYCTYQDKAKFYSYRRDGQHSGRMATLIYMTPSTR